MYTDEQRVRSLSRREVSVIYLKCQDKTLYEIAEIIKRDIKTVQHYITKAYKKLELTNYPKEQKETYLKKLYCHILFKYVETPEDIENWVPIDPKTGTALLIVEVEKKEDEEERKLGLIKYKKPEIKPYEEEEEEEEEKKPPRRWWLLIVAALIGVIVYLLTRPPQPPLTLVQTVVITPPPVDVAQVVPTDTLAPTETLLPTTTPTNTPESLNLQGLIAYYSFNGDANDTSGNQHNGITLGASLTDDRLGNPESAYLFDGVDDHITVLNAPELQAGLKPLSVTLWFNSHDLKWDPLVSKFLNNSSKDWGIRIREGYLEFGSENGTSAFADYVCRQASKTIQPVQWYFAAFVASEPTVSLYLNGEPVGVCSDFVNKWVSTIADVEIGRDGYGKHYFRGIIDDVRIYNRVLTEQEITQLYNSQSPIK